MKRDPELKAQFEIDAIRQYSVESLHFVDDVHSFKLFFLEKGDGWRRQKARMLLNTYIQVESVMEINISQAMRMAIINEGQRILEDISKDTRPLEQLFDKAVEDIVSSVLRDVWIQFDRDRELFSADNTTKRVLASSPQ